MWSSTSRLPRPAADAAPACIPRTYQHTLLYCFTGVNMTHTHYAHRTTALSHHIPPRPVLDITYVFKDQLAAITRKDFVPYSERRRMEQVRLVCGWCAAGVRLVCGWCAAGGGRAAGTVVRAREGQVEARVGEGA